MPVTSSKSNPDWSLSDGGLSRINDDFSLLAEYFQSAYSSQFSQLCATWGPFILTEEERESLEQLPESERTEKKLEKVRPYFLPFWSFFVAVCHALQEGENELTTTDAFWLGLIDEPIGHENLPLTRYFAEFHEEPKPTLAENAATQDSEPPAQPAKPPEAETQTTEPSVQRLAEAQPA